MIDLLTAHRFAHFILGVIGALRADAIKISFPSSDVGLGTSYQRNAVVALKLSLLYLLLFIYFLKQLVSLNAPSFMFWFERRRVFFSHKDKDRILTPSVSFRPVNINTSAVQ